MPHEDHFPNHHRNNDANTRALEEVAEGIADIGDTLREALLGRSKPNSLNGEVTFILGRQR